MPARLNRLLQQNRPGADVSARPCRARRTEARSPPGSARWPRRAARMHAKSSAPRDQRREVRDRHRHEPLVRDLGRERARGVVVGAGLAQAFAIVLEAAHAGWSWRGAAVARASRARPPRAGGSLALPDRALDSVAAIPSITVASTRIPGASSTIARSALRSSRLSANRPIPLRMP